MSRPARPFRTRPVLAWAASAWIIPFAQDRSQSAAERFIVDWWCYPEASLCLGWRTSLGPLEFRADANAGGDVFLEASRLELVGYGPEVRRLAWAATPWLWLRPALVLALGRLLPWAWNDGLFLEASAVLAVGDPLFIYERFRWEIGLFWRF